MELWVGSLTRHPTITSLPRESKHNLSNAGVASKDPLGTDGEGPKNEA
jgi:hypothetical protein